MKRKLAKAARITSLSNSPRTWTETVNAIPECVLAACTARQIANIANAMRRQYLVGYDAGWRESQP